DPMSTGSATANLHRVRRALRRYGIKGSAREAAGLVRSVPARRRALRADRAFDEQLGVDTSGIVRLHELSFESENKELGSRYEATSPESFERVMSQLELGDRELTFVDLGAGKGRALLLASRLPFRRLVGVEFSPELTAIGQRNVEAWRQRHPDCPDIELVCQDATTYEFPDEPLLVYMYNPFEAPVLLEVLANLRASLQRSPRPVMLVSITPWETLDALTSSGFAAASPPELFLPAAM
ncbi:MAG TPA: class I SAM-dependent methyltransferase, partial [Baekduia sp.]|nr:class I SAM-dependent methyltransferase [Baekduia sp.]